MPEQDEPFIPRDELRAALAARRELGLEREAEVVDAFLARVEQRLGERLPARRDVRGEEQRRFALALISLGVAVPLTAIAIANGGLAALAIVWIGIVLVNALFARRA